MADDNARDRNINANESGDLQYHHLDSSTSVEEGTPELTDKQRKVQLREKRRQRIRAQNKTFRRTYGTQIAMKSLAVFVGGTWSNFIRSVLDHVDGDHTKAYRTGSAALAALLCYVFVVLTSRLLRKSAFFELYVVVCANITGFICKDAVLELQSWAGSDSVPTQFAISFGVFVMGVLLVHVATKVMLKLRSRSGQPSDEPYHNTLLEIEVAASALACGYSVGGSIGVSIYGRDTYMEVDDDQEANPLWLLVSGIAVVFASSALSVAISPYRGRVAQLFIHAITLGERVCGVVAAVLLSQSGLLTFGQEHMVLGSTVGGLFLFAMIETVVGVLLMAYMAAEVDEVAAADGKTANHSRAQARRIMLLVVSGLMLGWAWSSAFNATINSILEADHNVERLDYWSKLGFAVLVTLITFLMRFRLPRVMPLVQVQWLRAVPLPPKSDAAAAPGAAANNTDEQEVEEAAGTASVEMVERGEWMEGDNAANGTAISNEKGVSEPVVVADAV